MNHDGSVTTLEEIPDKITGLKKDAKVVVAVASGISTLTPGIDIVRKDPKDVPYIHNTDHYTVMEKLTGHPEYSIFVARAGVDDSEELRNAIDSWVWIIRPIREPGTHWSKEIPAHMQQAKEKTEQSSADNPTPSGTSDAYACGMPDSGGI